MTIYYQDDQTTVYHGDCIEVMRNMPENSVDAIVTDPPYGLGFMGAKWDALPPGKDWAEECLRVLKPGGHLLAFGGTRTWHRLAVAIEDAGFEIRDSVMWLYGSGFPKSHDVGKAIDKMGGSNNAFKEFAKAYAQAITESGMTHSAIDKHLGIKSSSCYWAREDHRGGMPPRRHWGAVKQLLSLDDSLDHLYDEAEREVVGTDSRTANSSWLGTQDGKASTWGVGQWNITAPATPEAVQWDGWGTALKPANEPIVMARKPFKGTVAANVLEHGTGAINIDATRIGTTENIGTRPAPTKAAGWGMGGEGKHGWMPSASGRWPANVILDEHTAAWVDEQSGHRRSSGVYDGDGSRDPGDHATGFGGGNRPSAMYADQGGASRFFYSAKAPKSERPNVDGVQHPTVKPLAIMRWLTRLVTPPGGVVLDPFAGSGTTIEAALLEGFQSIGIELTDEYLPLIQQRIQRQRGLL